jgi:hypothetical protein
MAGGRYGRDLMAKPGRAGFTAVILGEALERPVDNAAKTVNQPFSRGPARVFSSANDRRVPAWK